MLHLRQLQCALAIDECGSFQRAADTMGITPSGLTQSVQRLEEHYGGRLFVRSRTGVSLTSMGEIVLEGARAILQRAESIEREIQLVHSHDQGELSIGVDPTLSNAVLGPALSQIINEHPGLRFKVTSDNRRALAGLLADRAIDLMVCYPERNSTVGNLQPIPFSIPAPLVIGRAGHPLAKKRNPAIHEFFDYPRLGAQPPEWYTDWATIELHAIPEDIDPGAGYHLHSNDIGLMKTIVQNSDAVMGIHRADVALELEMGKVVAMNPANWPERVALEVVVNAERSLVSMVEKLVLAITEADAFTASETTV